MVASVISFISVALRVPLFIATEQIRETKSIAGLKFIFFVIMLRVMRVLSNGYHYGGLPQVALCML